MSKIRTKLYISSDAYLRLNIKDDSNETLYIRTADGELWLTAIQIAGLHHYIVNSTEHHLGNNLYAYTKDADVITLQNYHLDQNEQCLLPLGALLSLRNIVLQKAFVAFKPLLTVEIPCFISHTSGNQEEALNCGTCNPDYWIMQLL